MLRRALSLMGLGVVLVGCAANGGNTGTNPTSTPSGAGSVVVSTDRATYAPADAIMVTVRNGLSRPIYAMDTQASCSIVSLQYQVGGAWQASQMAQCPQKRPARPIKIDAGATYTATITAGYPGLQQLNFPTGSYRLVLAYTTSPSAIPSTQDGATVMSATVQVR